MRFFAGVRGSDDRATVEAKPEDVGDQALIRVFNRSSEIRPGCPLSTRGRRSADRPQSDIGIPLPWLRPRRCTILSGSQSGCWLPNQVDVFTPPMAQAYRQRD